MDIPLLILHKISHNLYLISYSCYTNIIIYNVNILIKKRDIIIQLIYRSTEKPENFVGKFDRKSCIICQTKFTIIIILNLSIYHSYLCIFTKNLGRNLLNFPTIHLRYLPNHTSRWMAIISLWTLTYCLCTCN